MTESVTIKGTSDGLVITLGDGPLTAVLDEMESRLASKASFFVGGRVALRVGDRALSVDQLESIGSKIESAGVTLWAVEGINSEVSVLLRSPQVAEVYRDYISALQASGEHFTGEF